MKPYGCHSKPRNNAYWSKQVIYKEPSVYSPTEEWVLIPDTMTKECQYRKTTPDERCKGCTCP